MKFPSYSTIYRHAKKTGYYSQEKFRSAILPEKLVKDKWVIILDEKLLYLRQKMLLILGIKEENIPDNRALKFEDMQVLSVEVSEKTDHHMVGSLIEKAEEKLTMNSSTAHSSSIAYAISDEGLNLRRAIKDKNLEYLGDFRHLIANIFKKLYQKDTSYIEVTKQMVYLRKKLQQTELAELRPPELKTKCRFHNIDTITDWWWKVKGYLKNNPEKKKAKETFQWIERYSKFFEELDKILSSAEAIISILSIKGIDGNTINEVMEILTKLETSNSKIFRYSIEEYFLQAKKLLGNRRKLLCFSDIIESMFGKHNILQSANRNLYASQWSVLSLSFMTAKIDNLDIKNIFEQVKLKDIDKWAEEKNLNKNRWKLRPRKLSDVNRFWNRKILEPLLI